MSPEDSDPLLSAPAGRLQAARCAGVVAKGFSLALPPETSARSSSTSSLQDPQAKRWRRAQESFYSNVDAVQSEIARCKPFVLEQLTLYAHEHRLEAVPSLSDSDVAAPP